MRVDPLGCVCSRQQELNLRGALGVSLLLKLERFVGARECIRKVNDPYAEFVTLGDKWPKLIVLWARILDELVQDLDFLFKSLDALGDCCALMRRITPA